MLRKKRKKMVSYIIAAPNPPRTLIGQPIIGCHSRSRYQQARSSKYPPPSYDNSHRRLRTVRREMPIERIPAYVTGYSRRHHDYDDDYDSGYHDPYYPATYSSATKAYGYCGKGRLRSFGDRVRGSTRRELRDLMDYCFDDDEEVSACNRYSCRYSYY
ncbi:hypothetical protein BGW36DRAFT_452653 [Talaromyces proteolyticus]|uniref:Uncharacterized protein n=1 Tax=Talaromyces proteolyticus TaxID=1131652 RepID=A0AAD4KRH1_9EURO|nr:uncharacterized protein BGW36DRAFT_452653 [Talaromyces proteolyticus]KAH8694892.1 hypothetical protein BGW36DRAFT_452653 [Talaromyces proteolyticus]